MPKKAFSSKVRQYRLSKVTYRIFDITKKEQDFIILILAVLLLSRLVVPYPNISMWFGFLLSSYSAIANDSIQTIRESELKSWLKQKLGLDTLIVERIRQ